MSIVKLKKVTLCGFFEEKTTILEELQKIGVMHIIPLRPAPSEPEKAASQRPEEAYKALRFLNDCPKKRRQVSKYLEFDVDTVVKQVLDNKQKTRDAKDKRDFLVDRIKSLEPWGDFILPPRGILYQYRLWFYVVPYSEGRHLPTEGLPWQIVHSGNQNLYIVVLSENEPSKDAMPVPRTHTGAESLSELNKKLNDVELEIEDLNAEREWLTRWIYVLSKNLANAEDQASLNHAAEQTMDCEKLFAIQGWIPARDRDKVKEFSEKNKLAFLLEDPQRTDSPPTLLDNPERLAGGEEIVGFYQAPGYMGWDPSIVIFFSFALFFAMILSDAGYAAVIWGILLVYWKKMGASNKGRRMRTLGAVIATTSIVYGIMAGGYFGVTPELLLPLKILDVNNFDGMMRLSIVVGVLHIALANGFMAYQERCNDSKYVPIGWNLFIFGGLFLWFAMTDFGPASLFKTLGILLLPGGVGLVAYYGSDMPVNNLFDLLKRIVKGLLALTNISKAFGDVLSYMRLFALGLASTSLALTFNDLAKGVADIKGIGLFLAILILLLGHTLNLLLSIMSGVVHGLRLNFIEFYNWGVSEEGYPFRSFAKKEIEEQRAGGE